MVEIKVIEMKPGESVTIKPSWSSLTAISITCVQRSDKDVHLLVQGPYNPNSRAVRFLLGGPVVIGEGGEEIKLPRNTNEITIEDVEKIAFGGVEKR